MREQFRAYKRQLIREIKQRIKPHMWESGFIKNPCESFRGAKTKYLMIYVWPDYKNGEKKIYKNQKFNFEIEGFTDEGVIVDSYSTIATKNWNDFFVEELEWIHKIADKVK